MVNKIKIQIPKKHLNGRQKKKINNLVQIEKSLCCPVLVTCSGKVGHIFI